MSRQYNDTVVCTYETLIDYLQKMVGGKSSSNIRAAAQQCIHDSFMSLDKTSEFELLNFYTQYESDLRYFTLWNELKETTYLHPIHLKWNEFLARFQLIISSNSKKLMVRPSELPLNRDIMRCCIILSMLYWKLKQRGYRQIQDKQKQQAILLHVIVSFSFQEHLGLGELDEKLLSDSACRYVDATHNILFKTKCLKLPEIKPEMVMTSHSYMRINRLYCYMVIGIVYKLTCIVDGVYDPKRNQFINTTSGNYNATQIKEHKKHIVKRLMRKTPQKILAKILDNIDSNLKENENFKHFRDPNTFISKWFHMTSKARGSYTNYYITGFRDLTELSELRFDHFFEHTTMEDWNIVYKDTGSTDENLGKDMMLFCKEVVLLIAQVGNPMGPLKMNKELFEKSMLWPDGIFKDITGNRWRYLVKFFIEQLNLKILALDK